MLRFGGFKPTVFVRRTKKNVYMPLPFGADHHQRVQIMSEAGINLGKTASIWERSVMWGISGWWYSCARRGRAHPEHR
jgi:hypothetical protein